MDDISITATGDINIGDTAKHITAAVLEALAPDGMTYEQWVSHYASAFDVPRIAGESAGEWHSRIVLRMKR